MLPLQRLYQDAETKVGESIETHCTTISFCSLQFFRVLRKKEKLIHVPAEILSYFKVFMYRFKEVCQYTGNGNRSFTLISYVSF